MREIEKRTEAIAKQMCKEQGLPVAMMELMLQDAYQLVYFGDKKELKRIEDKIKKKKVKKKWNKTLRRIKPYTTTINL